MICTYCAAQSTAVCIHQIGFLGTNGLIDPRRVPHLCKLPICTAHTTEGRCPIHVGKTPKEYVMSELGAEGMRRVWRTMAATPKVETPSAVGQVEMFKESA